MTVHTMSSYVGDPRDSDPNCAVETIGGSHPAPHPDAVSSTREASGPLHGLQPALSSTHLLHLPAQLPNHVDLPHLTSPPHHPLQPVQRLPHLHEPYHTTGDVYSHPSCEYTPSGVFMDNTAAPYDSSYYGGYSYTEIVSPPPIGSHTDVKPTEDELSSFRQRAESTQSMSSSCCGPYDSPTPLTAANIGDLGGGGGVTFEPQPSTSHDNSINSTGVRLGMPQTATKAGRPVRIKREPLCSESSGTGAAPDDLARRLRRRERNKVAAAKCRNKKKKQQEQLNKDHIFTRQQNELLQREVANLKAKVQELRDQLTNHSCCMITGTGQKSVQLPVPVSSPPTTSMANTTSSIPVSHGYPMIPQDNTAAGGELLRQHPNQQQQQMATRTNFPIQNTSHDHSQLGHHPQQTWSMQDNNNPWGGQMIG